MYKTAMPSINILPTHLVNKIAAGEVIERPASIVKELVENALDSGATQIDVVIEKGGKQLIAVTDNGCGMDAEDLERAFIPHATSKICSDEDLFNITTMGFRGEALASIASISHAHIRTRRRDDDSGYEIEASDAHVGDVKPAAGAPGTTVTVRDLFFNTPARRKFLRADSTEMGHISEMITRIALPNRKVGFTVRHNNRKMLDLPPASDLAQRVGDLFDPDMASQLNPLLPETEDVKVSGLIGPPSLGKATARWQYFFLNGRYIRDRFCQHALNEGYRGLIDPHRKPVAIVFMTVPPDSVDFNVHPTKTEVRFSDGQAVHSHVLAAIRQTLQQSEIRPSVQLPAGASAGDDDLPNDSRRQGLREALADFFKSQPTTQPKLSFPEHHDRSAAPASAATPMAPAPRSAPETERPWMTSASARSADSFTPPAEAQPSASIDASSTAEHQPAAPVEAPPADNTEPKPSEPTPAGRQVMQVHNTYLVIGEESGITIVDQHALHERIIYDQLLARMTAGPLESQGLLIPATVKVTPSQHALLQEKADLLGRLGIEVSEFGPDTMAIHRFPSLLEKVDPTAFLTDTLDQLAEGDPSLDQEHLVHSLLDMMACKAAVKAGDPLTPAEIDALLASGIDADKSTACPHGRPTQIRLTIGDLEKQFKRV